MEFHIGVGNCLRSVLDRSLPNKEVLFKLPWHGNRLVPYHRESPPRAAAAVREVGWPAQVGTAQRRPGQPVRGNDFAIRLGHTGPCVGCLKVVSWMGRFSILAGCGLMVAVVFLLVLAVIFQVYIEKFFEKFFGKSAARQHGRAGSPTTHNPHHPSRPTLAM